MHKVEPPGVCLPNAEDPEHLVSPTDLCLVHPPDEMLIFRPCPSWNLPVLRVCGGSPLLEWALEPLELRPESLVEPSDGLSSHSRTTRCFERGECPSLTPPKSRLRLVCSGWSRPPNIAKMVVVQHSVKKISAEPSLWPSHVHQSLRCPRSLEGLKPKVSRWSCEEILRLSPPSWASVFWFHFPKRLRQPWVMNGSSSSTHSHPPATPLAFLKAALIQSQVSLKWKGIPQKKKKRDESKAGICLNMLKFT